jgi:hypothetical protein
MAERIGADDRVRAPVGERVTATGRPASRTRFWINPAGARSPANPAQLAW